SVGPHAATLCLGSAQAGDARTRTDQAARQLQEERAMSVAVLEKTLSTAAVDKPAPAYSPMTRRLLDGPIVSPLLRMAWPNVFVMVAQSATGLIETWFVSKLGTDALAGMALVFPGVMLMQMISAGAMGGGISSAIARALGAGRRDQADALVLHALV